MRFIHKSLVIVLWQRWKTRADLWAVTIVPLWCWCKPCCLLNAKHLLHSWTSAHLLDLTGHETQRSATRTSIWSTWRRRSPPSTGWCASTGWRSRRTDRLWTTSSVTSQPSRSTPQKRFFPLDSIRTASWTSVMCLCKLQSFQMCSCYGSFKEL